MLSIGVEHTAKASNLDRLQMDTRRLNMHHFIKSALQLSPLSLALAAVMYTPAAMALNAPLDDAKIAGVQYAGGERVTLRWDAHDWENDTYASTIYLGDRRAYQSPYSLFARPIGGEYFLVADFKGTSDRTWAGHIPGLSESNAMQLQLRERHVETGEYSSGLQAPGFVIDVTDIDTPPSFENKGDLLELKLQPVSGGSSQNTQHQELNWAYNFSEGYEEIRRNHVTSVYTIGGIAAHLSDEERGTLFVGANSLDPTDGFAVFQTCNIDRKVLNSNGWLDWLGACSDEYPVVLRSERLPEHANQPSFTMGTRVDAGTDYSAQEHSNWASNIYAGDNATPTSSLLFNTIWVTNSGLFEEGPYISTPSGTLRYKFKEGVSGTSKMYVALSDWDQNSPENSYNTADLAHDHSMIHTLEFTVGADPQARAISNGARGSDLNGIPESSTSETAGGGGTAGFALFALGLLGFKRRK